MLNTFNLYENAFKIYYNTFIKSGLGVNVILEYPIDGNFDSLKICDNNPTKTIKKNINIILCGHNEELFPTKIGDNSKEYIEFSVFEKNDTQEDSIVKESRWIILDNTKYIIKKVYPSNIGSYIFLKDCIAQKER